MAAAAAGLHDTHSHYSITYPSGCRMFYAEDGGIIRCPRSGEMFRAYTKDALGDGGFGEVYQLCNASNELTPYVLKLFKRVDSDPDPQHTKEVHALAISGQLYGYIPGTDGIPTGVIMPCLGEVDLFQLAKAHEAAKSLTAKNFVLVAYHFIAAVTRFHAEEIYGIPKNLHRDLKLENTRVQLDETGNVIKAWLIDFGMAVALRGGRTYRDVACGTHLMPYSDRYPQHFFYRLCLEAYVNSWNKFEIFRSPALKFRTERPFRRRWSSDRVCFTHCNASEAYALGVSLADMLSTVPDEEKVRVKLVLSLCTFASLPHYPLPLSWIEKVLEASKNDIQAGLDEDEIFTRLAGYCEQAFVIYIRELLPAYCDAANATPGSESEPTAARELQRIYASFSVTAPPAPDTASTPHAASASSTGPGNAAASASSTGPGSAAASASSTGPGSATSAEPAPQTATAFASAVTDNKSKAWQYCYGTFER